jgi:hypothetical protein
MNPQGSTNMPSDDRVANAFFSLFQILAFFFDWVRMSMVVRRGGTSYMGD